MHAGSAAARWQRRAVLPAAAARGCSVRAAAAHPPRAAAKAAAAAAAPVHRRGLLLSTGLGLVSGAADAAAASEQPDGAAAATAAAADAATEPAAPPPAAGTAPAKKRKRPAGARKGRPRAPPKPPGTVPRVKLADDLEISQVIRGCWQLDGQHRGDALSDRTSGAAAIEDLSVFCHHGMFTLDTADNYNASELIIGQHLRLHAADALQTKVLTKLSFMAPPDAAELRREAIEYRVRSSIARLGVTSLDLLQLHWEPPMQRPPPGGKAAPPPGFVTAARVLKQLQAEGVIKRWGVSNFDVPMLLALLDAGLKPTSNQVAYSAIDRRPQLFVSRLCEARGIPLLAYGTMAGGFLSERYLGLPANKARIDTLSKARYGTLLTQLGGWSWLQDMLQVLHDVGAKHGVSASCVAGRWVLQQPGVAAIVLGARNATHVRDAQRLFSFELDDGDLFDLDAAYEGATQPTTDVYAWERGGEW